MLKYNNEIIQWFRGVTRDLAHRSQSLLLFGHHNGGLLYEGFNGGIFEGEQIITAELLGLRVHRGRFIHRAQRRFLRRKRQRFLMTMLQCLPYRLGQNTWLRIRQFTKRSTVSFLEKLGLSYLGPFVSIVSLFVNNSKWDGCIRRVDGDWRPRRVDGDRRHSHYTFGYMTYN